MAGTGSPPPGPGLIASARERAAPVVEWLDESVVGRLWARLLEMEFVERSIALAAKAFVSLLPLLLVVAAFLPPRLQRGVLDELAERLGLSGDSLAFIQARSPRPTTSRPRPACWACCSRCCSPSRSPPRCSGST
jgi:membrane protein